MSNQQIAILTNQPDGVFQSLVIDGASREFQTRGLTWLVDEHPQGLSRIDDLGFDLKSVAGLLMIANVATSDVLKALHERGALLSLVSNHMSGLAVPEVVFNNRQGVQALVRHLVVDCGRRNLVYIGGIRAQYDGLQRALAFEMEMMRHNIEHYQQLEGEFDPIQAAAVLRAFVSEGGRFDGLFAADYLMAIAAVETLRELGWRVPQDVAVVGFGDAEQAAQAGITTVAANVQELGARAARQLLSQIDGLRIRGMTTLSVDLIIRETSCDKA